MPDLRRPPARIVADTLKQDLLETVTALQLHWRADPSSPHTSAWHRHAAEMLSRLTGSTLALMRLHKVNRNGRCLGCARLPRAEDCPVTATLVRYGTGPIARVWTMMRDDSRGEIRPLARLLAPGAEPPPGTRVVVIGRAPVVGDDDVEGSGAVGIADRAPRRGHQERRTRGTRGNGRP